MAKISSVIAVVALFAVLGLCAAEIPILTDACKGANAGTGCCPAHRMLLELENSGCDIAMITDGTAAEASSMCTTCGSKLGDIAKVYAGATGESCLLVHYTLRMFPFACEDDGAGTPCAVSIKDTLTAVSADASSVTTAQLDAVCPSCWQKFLVHMEDSTYNVAGVETPDYVDRIGGAYATLLCMQSGGEYCVPQLGVLSELPTLPDYLYEWTGAAVDPKFCSGCNRALLSNAYGIGSTESLEQSEFARRLLLSSCPVGGNAGCRDVVDAAILKAERERLQIGWANCIDLFTAGNPVCTAACKDYLTSLQDRVGCCSRYALENTALFNTAPVGFPTPTTAYVAQFLDLAASPTDAALPGCGIDLRSNCVDGTVVFTGSLHADFVSPSNDAEGMTLTYAGRQDLARLTGALVEDITILDVTGNVDFSIQCSTDAATNTAGEVFTSMVTEGAMYSPTINTLLAGSVTGAAPIVNGVCRDDVIPNYHYLPALGTRVAGTYTTDCLTLKLTQPSVDCTQATYNDGTTKFWLVTAGMLTGAESCTAAPTV